MTYQSPKIYFDTVMKPVNTELTEGEKRGLEKWLPFFQKMIDLRSAIFGSLP